MQLWACNNDDGKLGEKITISLQSPYQLTISVTISALKMQFFTVETPRAKIFSTRFLGSQSSSFSQKLGSGYTELTDTIQNKHNRYTMSRLRKQN